MFSSIGFSFSMCSAVLSDGWCSAGLCSEVLSDGWCSAGLCSASGDVPPLKMVISIPFCLFLFSLYLYPLSAPAPFLYSLSAPFLNPSLFSLSLFPLASPPFLLSLLINSPSS